jgi:signal transduction histidine kinase/CheY-like chemotaxis protein
MTRKRGHRSKGFDAPGVFIGLLAFLVLGLIVSYFYIYRHQPDAGFNLSQDTGVVVFVRQPCPDDERCLREGDRVLKIADIDVESQLSDRTVPLLEPFTWGGAVLMVVERDGRILTVEHRPVSTSRGAASSFAILFFPLLFWSIGTLTAIFLRPRDERWWLLILFQFDTALWASAGFLGFSRVAYSVLVFRIGIWLFLPLSVHLHLILPNAPFRRYHRYLLPPLYLIAGTFIVLDLQTHLPRNYFQWTTLLAMVASLGLLAVRFFLPMSSVTRAANRVMLYGVGLGLGPAILMVMFSILDLRGFIAADFVNVVGAVFLLVSPLWPLTYIYAIYKHDLGTFEFRANRLLGAYGFFAVYITTYILVFNYGTVWLYHRLDEALTSLVISLTFVALGPPLYTRFQRFVDRRVFGIKYQPNEVVSVFAAKIPSAFNREVLRGVIVDEILPTLMVRQSALYVFGSGEARGTVETIYAQGVPEHVHPEVEDLNRLLERAGSYISFSKNATEAYSWVRLVVELKIHGKIIGVWLFGRRDPDDYYPSSDIKLLGNLANQIAPVIENVRLVEQARQEVEENKRLQEQLIHSQKMEAIGRLSAGVAHDFNNILSVIIGYSNLVLGQYRPDDTLRQALVNIRDAGERAANLTKQLLAFSRQQVMEARVTSLNHIISEVGIMLKRLTGEDVELAIELSDELPNVRIDPGQMGQVIVNLAVNARDAMPEGGRLSIETRAATCRRRGECHDEVPPGAYAVLVVRDTGAGVAPQIQTQIFEPYFTTKEKGKGTGLGLSMVYGIINQSQGYICVDSDVGLGTTFTIYLPAVAEEVPDEDRERLAPVSREGSETILLVEDEESVRAVAGEILSSCGYQVLVAENGRRALEIFRRHASDVDLLLTDVVMPKMKGTDLARLLLERRPDLQVIYMSGYNEESILGRRIGEDGSVLIQKPFTPQTLAAKIREVLDGSSRVSSVAAELEI